MPPKKSTKRFDITGLKVMQSSIKKLDDGKYRVQVGIFGDKDARKEGAGPTNAEIGFIHEMGSHAHGIPRRSFLWDTFTFHGEQLMKTLKPVTETLFKKGKVDEYLKEVGIACTNLVVEAFHTGGWGAWAPLKYATLLAKLKGSLKKRKALIGQIYAGQGGDTPLTDSGQLWQSIASRTVKS